MGIPRHTKRELGRQYDKVMAVYYSIIADFHECIFSAADQEVTVDYADGTSEKIEDPFSFFNARWIAYCEWWNAQSGHHEIDKFMFYNYAIKQ